MKNQFDPIELAKENKQRVTDKQNFNNHWQIVSELVLARKSDFTSESEPGEFLQDEIFDATAPKALQLSSSAILGMVWSGGKSFDIEVSSDELKEDDEVKNWFNKVVTPKLAKALDDPKAGLLTALDEFMTDAEAFGTPCLAAFESKNPAQIFNFKTWNVRQFTIRENADGVVDSVWREYKSTVRKLIEKHKLENLHEKVQKLAKDGKFDEKIRVLHTIEPRNDHNPDKRDRKNLPVASVYTDLDNMHTMEESGFNERSVFVTRFYKRAIEDYGRSPAMEALPDILMANALKEALIMGIEKQLDPPLALYDDGSFGGGVIDTGASALNVVKVDGALGTQNPIQPLFTVGSIAEANALLESLQASIKEHFFIDRLLDLNSQNEMTAREAVIRNAMRSTTMRTIVNRLTAELFTPLIERCFNVMLRAGHFGVLPGSIEHQNAQALGQDLPLIPEGIARMSGSDEDVYTVKYKTPAARDMEAEEVSGIINTMETAKGIADIYPEIVDKINWEAALERVAAVGSASGIMHSDDEVDTIREGRQEGAEEAQQQEQMAGLAAAASGGAEQ